ncbi:Sn1-specific diacylglycerol lipase alpha [Astathelohania contejeani]|uniref:sn-1-specific diacylglycerol lipase n=1 Tax=Astathelohania contejeani TaxID=164912 RepID=A0ABQ7HVI7_9MICR|nr:Sn1-specific diacylglycerol lipase alpha [Thelohania contejeani]
MKITIKILSNLFSIMVGKEECIPYFRDKQITDRTVEYMVYSFHDNLFGTEKIIFYKMNMLTKEMIGFVEIQNRQFTNNQRISVDLPIYAAKYFSKYTRFTTRTPICTLQVDIIVTESEKYYHPKELINSNLLNGALSYFLKEEYILHFYNLYRLYTTFFEGTGIEKYYFIRGIMALEGRSMHNTTDDYTLFPSTFYETHDRYFHYAIASYGKFILTRLVNKKRKVCDKIPEDRRWVLEYSGADEDQLLEVDMNFIVPHIILEIEDEIVVSISGTKDHNDALNDLNCEYEKMEGGGYAHRGIMRLAEKFIEERLEKILNLYKNKKMICLTGHSLGGGIATIASVLLERRYPEIRSRLRVVAYASPPVLSEDACIQTKMDIQTLVHGADIVPRLCIGTALDLKMHACAIANSYLWDMHIGTEERINIVYQSIMKENFNPKLYIPGRLFHLQQFNIHKKMPIRGIFSKLSANPPGGEIVALVKEVDRNYFNFILIDNQNLVDHSFTAIVQALSSGIK